MVWIYYKLAANWLQFHEITDLPCNIKFQRAKNVLVQNTKFLWSGESQSVMFCSINLIRVCKFWVTTQLNWKVVITFKLSKYSYNLKCQNDFNYCEKMKTNGTSCWYQHTRNIDKWSFTNYTIWKSLPVTRCSMKNNKLSCYMSKLQVKFQFVVSSQSSYFTKHQLAT